MAVNSSRSASVLVSLGYGGGGRGDGGDGGIGAEEPHRGRTAASGQTTNETSGFHEPKEKRRRNNIDFTAKYFFQKLDQFGFNSSNIKTGIQRNKKLILLCGVQLPAVRQI